MYVIMKYCLVWITIQCFNSDWLTDGRVTWSEQLDSYTHNKLEKVTVERCHVEWAIGESLYYHRETSI
jgi:hypothetical protein